jgi:hypothetical protein
MSLAVLMNESNGQYFEYCMPIPHMNMKEYYTYKIHQTNFCFSRSLGFSKDKKDLSAVG